MKLLFLLPALASASLLDSAAKIFARQAASNEAYVTAMCSPNVTNPAVIPPCISITTIETLCAPNGTTPLAYAAHAQCLCNAPSTFFADWLGCRKCLQVHGGLSELQYNQYSAIIGAASSSMCGATPPSTDFAHLFTMISNVPPQSGATTTSDQFPSQTDVSLYYTPAGTQGPGVITGSAAGATASGSDTTAGPSTTTTPANAQTGSGSGSTTSSTRNMAMVTSAPLKPLALAIAGGMAIAAL